MQVTTEDTAGQGLTVLVLAYLTETEEKSCWLVAVAPHLGLSPFQYSLVYEVRAAQRR